MIIMKSVQSLGYLAFDCRGVGLLVWVRVHEQTFKLATDSDSKSNMASSARIIQSNSAWFQKKINLRPQHRGVHLVTEEILRQIPELSQFAMGLCHVQSECPCDIRTGDCFSIFDSSQTWTPDCFRKPRANLAFLYCSSTAHECQSGAERELGSRC